MYEESKDKEVQKNDERIDSRIDRIYQHPLKNCKLKILYQEQHVGIINWYKKTLDKYRIPFDDGTEGYFNLGNLGPLISLRNV